MPKITALTAETTLADGDLIPVVDVDDTTQSVNGSTNKVTLATLFTTTPFTSRALSASLIDGKGELIVGSANDAIDNLAAGTNGHLLTADSGQTLGVKWAALTELDAFVQATYNPNIVAATGAAETISMDTAVHFLTMDQACVLTISDTAGSDEFKMCVVFLSGAFAITWKNGESPVLSASVGQAFG
jgi:hypothetical protein